MQAFDKSNARISGITFKPVENVRHSVSHAERTELCEAKYLLDPSDRLANNVIFGGGRENEITELFYAKKARMSRQAIAAGASPFWEGVAVLPHVDEFESVEAYNAEMEKRLMRLKADFEEKTGCTVLLISTHLDEGFKDPETGIVSRNPHAHILIDRTIRADLNPVRNRDHAVKKKRAVDPDRPMLWHTTPGILSKIQALCADALQMQRGLTRAERGGKPGRKHIPHKEWRELKAAEAAQQAVLLAQLKSVTQEKDGLVANGESMQEKLFLANYKNKSLVNQYNSLHSSHGLLELEKIEQLKIAATEINDLRAKNNSLHANYTSLAQRANGQIKIAATEVNELRAENNSLKEENKLLKAELAKANYSELRTFVQGTNKGTLKHYKNLKKWYESGSSNIKKFAEYIRDSRDNINSNLDIEALLWLILDHDIKILKELRESDVCGFAGDNGEVLDKNRTLNHFGLKILEREKENESLYLRDVNNENEKRLVLVERENEFIVKMKIDHDYMGKVIRYCEAKWPDGFEIFGTPEFVKNAEEWCREFDISNYKIRDDKSMDSNIDDYPSYS